MMGRITYALCIVAFATCSTTNINAIAQEVAPSKQNAETIQTDTDPRFEQVELSQAGHYPILVIRTNAHTPEQFRTFVNGQKHSVKFSEKPMFEIRFYPQDTKNLPDVAEIERGASDDSWQRKMVANYIFNKISQVDSLEVYLESPKLLLATGSGAIELHSQTNSGMTTVLIKLPNGSKITIANAVAEFYEGQVANGEWLTLYFVNSDTKWDIYPRIWPSEMPKAVVFVYQRRPNAKGEIVRAADFR